MLGNVFIITIDGNDNISLFLRSFSINWGHIENREAVFIEISRHSLLVVWNYDERFLSCLIYYVHFCCFVEANQTSENLAEEQEEQIEPTIATNASSGMIGLFLDVSACSVIPVDWAL